MAIRFFDMFAGIGGFRSGLEAVGGFKCIGHCEIDKKANTAYCAIYDTEGEYFCDDARKIDPKRMPDFDLICAGFPCQSFSVSGKRRGFSDMRGTLIFEVARIVGEKRPAFLLLENVIYVLKCINDVMNRNQLCKVLSPKSSETEQIALFHCS